MMGRKILHIAFAVVLTALVMTVLAMCGNDDEQEGGTATHWAKTFGSAGSEGTTFTSVDQTVDGGFIVAGTTNSFGAGGFDFWVIRLGADGSITWQKTFGGPSFDGAAFIQQTADGGFIAAGSTDSFFPSRDMWVLRLDPDGVIVWQKTFGGLVAGSESASVVRQTADSGFILTGQTDSFGAGGADFWLLKLDSGGNIGMQKTYGGTGDDIAYSIRQTDNGGFIVAGSTDSFGAGNNDFWVLRLDPAGGIIWQKTFGGAGNDVARCVQQTGDGGFIVAGHTESFGAGGADFWILRLASDGSIGASGWQKTLGGAGDDIAYSLTQTSDGGFAAAGRTSSFGAGGKDFYLLKLNSGGSIEWQKTYGDTGNDIANTIRQTGDGGYLAAGETASFGAGGNDFWVIRLKSDGTVAPSAPTNIGTNTFALPQNTFILPDITAITPADTFAATADTSITPLGTNAVIFTQASD